MSLLIRKTIGTLLELHPVSSLDYMFAGFFSKILVVTADAILTPDSLFFPTDRRLELYKLNSVA